jgi:hypothetical protein
MYCMSCGQDVQVDAAFCSRCGEEQSAASAGQAGGAPPSGAPSPPGGGYSGARDTISLSFDAARWSRGELVAGVSTAVLFVALFLPWFGLSVGGVNLGGTGIPGLSLDALDADGWMYITLLVALALMAYLVLRAMLEDLRLPVDRWQALAGATGLNLLLTAIAFAAIPGGASIGGISAYSYTWSYGAFIGLLAALAAAGGAALHRREWTASERTLGAVESVTASPTSAKSAGAPQRESVACPACRYLNSVDNRFCRQCGGGLGDASGVGQASA